MAIQVSASDDEGPEPVLYRQEDDIAVIYLNRTQRLNAITPELIDRLCSRLEQAISADVAAAILTGSGRGFSSGHDLKYNPGPISDALERRQLQRIQDVTRLIRQASFPVIAAVHGYALGAGCELALCCDLVISDEKTMFGFPEVSVGLGVTGGISSLLPATVGAVRAKELLLLGKHFTASEALQLGLINEVCSEGEHLSRAFGIGSEIKARPRRAVALAKGALDRGLESGITAAMEVEVANSLLLSGSADAAAAAAEFRARSDDKLGLS